MTLRAWAPTRPRWSDSTRERAAAVNQLLTGAVTLVAYVIVGAAGVPGDAGLRLRAPDHSLFRFLTLEDATWHHHGFFAPPAGAQSLIDVEGGGSILYEDRASFPAGRIVATTLDPFAHHGTFFMPAATRFLHGFLPWICSEIGRAIPKVAQ